MNPREVYGPIRIARQEFVMVHKDLEDTVYYAAHILVELVRRCGEHDQVALSRLQADPEAPLRWDAESDAAAIRDLALAVLKDSGKAVSGDPGEMAWLDVDPVLRTAWDLLRQLATAYPAQELLWLTKVQAGAETVGEGDRLSPLEAQVVRAAAHKIFSADLRESEMKEAWPTLELMRIIKDYGFAAPDGISTTDLLAFCGRKRDYRDVALDRTLSELFGYKSKLPSMDELFHRYEDVPMLGLVLRSCGGRTWYVEEAVE